MREFFLVAILTVLTFSASAEVELGTGVELFQYDENSKINFTESNNFTEVDLWPSTSLLGSSNFTASPESDVSVKMDFYETVAGRQDFVTNYTAKTSSTQNTNFSLTELPSTEFYEAFDSDTDKRFFIGYTDSGKFDFTVESLDSRNVSVFNYGEKGVEVNNIGFNDSNPVEGQLLDIQANLSNEGVVDPETANVTVVAETYNGTQWVEKDFLTDMKNVPRNSSTISNLSWSIKPGPWSFKVTSDPEDEIKETDETNNVNSTSLEVPSYQIFYGNSSSSMKLGASTNDFYLWQPEKATGNLYLYDVDSNLNFYDLEPVGDSDLVELDQAMQLQGHNDSISELWDRDGDGNIDRTKQIDVGARTLDVPVTNSTENSPFDTGILYDSGDGSPYDGSQDLVFITEMQPGTAGSFGTYDYEIRVPFSLRSLKPGSDRVQFYQELK